MTAEIRAGNGRALRGRTAGRRRGWVRLLLGLWLALGVGPALLAKPLALSWVKAAVDGTSAAQALVAVPDGGTVQAGNFSGTLTLGSGEAGQIALQSPSALSLYLVHLHGDGTLAWAKQSAPVTNAALAVLDLAPLPDGSVVVLLQNSGTSVLGPGEAQQTTLTDGTYLAKYAADGSLAWVISLGSVTVALAPQADGGVVVLDNGAGSGYTLTKYGATATVQWMKTASHCVGAHLAAVAGGGFLVTGSVNGSGVPASNGGFQIPSDGLPAVFGPGEAGETALAAAGSFHLFLARYAADGHLLWARTAADGLALPYAIAGGADGSCALVGQAYGAATFGPGTAAAASATFTGQDMFVGQVAADGTLGWLKRVAQVYPSGGVALATDGGVALTGINLGNAVFAAGEAQQTPLPGSGQVVAQYAADGTLVAARQESGGLQLAVGVEYRGIAVLSAGDLTVAGTGTAATVWGADTVAPVAAGFGGQWFFQARYTPASLLSLVKAGGGSGTVSVNGQDFALPSVVPCPPARSLTVQAHAAALSAFSGWSGALSGSSNPSPLVLSTDATLTATFAVTSTYPIVATAGVNGSVSPAGTTTVSDGATPTYVMVPNTGCHVADVLVDGLSVGAVTIYTFAPVHGSHTLAASFALYTFSISASAGANGAISPAGVTVVSYGSSQTFALVPNTGYHVADVLVDGSSVGPTTVYTFTDVAASHVIAAAFAINTYTITASASSGGSIAPAGVSTLNYGTTQTYALVPNSGYGIADVQVDGSSVGAPATYTFANVAASHTITASFAALYPALTGPASGGTSATPTFTWIPVIGADHYELYVSDTTANVYPIVYQLTLTGTSWVCTTTLPLGHSYSAWLRSVTAAGAAGNWSAAWPFSIAPLGLPTLTGPTPALQTTPTPQITWTAVPNATQYDLYVLDLTTNLLAVRNSAATGTNWTVGELTFGHSYRVYARAGTTTQWGDWNLVYRDFSVAALGLPTVTGPTPAVQTTPTPQIAWTAVPNATQYDIYVLDLTTGALGARNAAATGTTWTSTALPYGHSYRVYARAGTATQWGDWNLVYRDFSTVDPSIPLLTAPTGVQPTPTPQFVWSATGALDYEIYVADLTLSGVQVLWTTGRAAPTWTPPSLTFGHSFRAWIRGRTGVGTYTDWTSAPVDFSVANLGVPTVSSPTGTTSTATPLIAWNTVIYATVYDVYVADLTLGTMAARNPAATGTSWVCSTLPYGHQFAAYVRAGVAGSPTQWGGWSAPANFLTSDPTIPMLTAPSGVQSTATPQFSWTAATGALDYEIYVADLTMGSAMVVWPTGLTGTTWTATPALHFGHSYRAWIRGRTGASSYSDWSPIPANFSVEPIAVPLLTAPSGAQASSTVSITWNAAAHATTYDVYVADATLGFALAVRNQTATGTSWTPAAFTPGHSYRVWARGLNGADASDWSSSLDFAIAALATPALTAPTGAQSSTTPTFTWGAIPNALTYELWVNDQTSGPNPALHQTTLTGTSYSPPALTNGHTYTAYIRASAGTATSAWSSGLSFSITPLGALVVATPLVAPSTLSPAGSIGDTQPIFTWQVTTGADHYELLLDDLTTGQAGVVSTRLAHVTQWQIDQPLVPGHTYRWQLRALFGTDVGPWSPYQYFDVQ